MRSFVASTWTIVLAFLAPHEAEGFAFIFAGEANGVDVVAFPNGYNGTGGVVNVSVGIDPTSANAADMVTPTRNTISIINGLAPTTGNLTTANVPAAEWDFESVLLHEMLHSVGLAHPNLGTSVADVENMTDLNNQRESSNSTDGVDNTFNLDPGADNIYGSSDDVRGDDVNLNWFQISNNNPFTIAATVDSTTYSRDLADLPTGQTWSTNAERTVADELFGFASTEAAAQQGSPNGEAQRTLGHDDVAGLRFAMAGSDHLAGTADDYTLNLTYAGLTATADIVIDFDSSQTSFAVSTSSGATLGDDAVITGTEVYFHETAVTWFFNDVLIPEPSTGGLMLFAGTLLLRRRR